MKKIYSVTDYKKNISFLQEIPYYITSQLSVDEFYFPDAIIQSARKELESYFHQNVMAYKADVFRSDLPLVMHLCAHYQGAMLTKEHVSLLSFYETKFQYRNVRFVVYKKPLTKIAIEESPFFQ